MKPKHYEGQVDPIALMESQFNADQLYGFFAGNVIKYVSRAHKKNGYADLEKASDYLNRLKRLEAETEAAGLRAQIDRETATQDERDRMELAS